MGRSASKLPFCKPGGRAPDRDARHSAQPLQVPWRRLGTDPGLPSDSVEGLTTQEPCLGHGPKGHGLPAPLGGALTSPRDMLPLENGPLPGWAQAGWLTTPGRPRPAPPWPGAFPHTPGEPCPPPLPQGLRPTLGPLLQRRGPAAGRNRDTGMVLQAAGSLCAVPEPATRWRCRPQCALRTLLGTHREPFSSAPKSTRKSGWSASTTIGVAKDGLPCAATALGRSRRGL